MSNESLEPAQTEQPPQPLRIVEEAIGSDVWLASPDSEQAFTISEQEADWLYLIKQNHFNYNSDQGVRIQQLIPEGQRNLATLLEYRQARDSFVDKINTIYGQEALVIDQDDSGEVMRLKEGVTLDYRASMRNKEPTIVASLAHPANITSFAVQALHRLTDKEELLSEARRVELEARVGRILLQIREREKHSMSALQFSEQQPRLARAIRDELRQEDDFKDVEIHDVDWMLRANCIGQDPGPLTSPYKPNDTWRQTLCEPCPVSEQCYTFAAAHKTKNGLWGGLTEAERKDRAFTEAVATIQADTEAQLSLPAQDLRAKTSTLMASRLRTYIKNISDSPLKTAQLPAMKSIARHFQMYPDLDPNGRVVMPTGTGKTVLFVEFIRAVDLKTVVLVPTQKLVHQTIERLNQFHEDGDVGKVYADEKNPNASIVVTTYNSFIKHISTNSGMFSLKDIELLVLDEAHKGLGKRSFELLQSIRHIPQIGFTATDEYDQDKKVENLLPNRIYQMEIEEGINERLIVPFQTILVEGHADLSGVKISSSSKDFDEKQLAEAVDIIPRNELAASLYAEHFRGRKAIFFCVGIKHAEEMADMLREKGIRAAAIYGAQSTEQKNKIFADLKRPISSGGLEVITNDKILTEGMDQDDIGVCFNLRPTLSKVVSRQRNGRILRTDSLDPEKVATIVEFVDEKTNRPPYLFPDPEVAKHVSYAGDKDITNQLIAIDQDGVICDPETIMQLTKDMSRERRVLDGLAPYGWVTADDILDFAIAKAGITDEPTMRMIKDAYGHYRDSVWQSVFSNEELSGTWMLVGKGYDQKYYAFSPETATKLIEEYSKKFIYHNPAHMEKRLVEVTKLIEEARRGRRL